MPVLALVVAPAGINLHRASAGGPNPGIVNFWRGVRNDSARLRAKERRTSYAEVRGEWGERSWNSRTKFSSVSTVEAISSLPRANNSSSTISNSRTNPSAARLAKPSGSQCSAAPLATPAQPKLRPAPPAPSAGRRRPSPSSLRRAAPFFAANVSRHGGPQQRLRPFRFREPRWRLGNALTQPSLVGSYSSPLTLFLQFVGR